jgi:hypothetical protein
MHHGNRRFSQFRAPASRSDLWQAAIIQNTGLCKTRHARSAVRATDRLEYKGIHWQQRRLLGDKNDANLPSTCIR